MKLSLPAIGVLSAASFGCVSGGPVPADKVEGHAVWTYWPLSAFGHLK